MREHGEKVLVKLFQKFTVSRGGAFVAVHRQRNPFAFAKRRKGEFLTVCGQKEGNPRRGFPCLVLRLFGMSFAHLSFFFDCARHKEKMKQ